MTDLALLRALVADRVRDEGDAPCDGLSDVEHDAFVGMLDTIERDPRRTLSSKQRGWAQDVAKRVGCAARPGFASRSGDAVVPRGAPVATPAVLRVLPKHPPGRRPPGGDT